MGQPQMELILDYFAGGGGASEGIERALGRPVDIAINHDPAAIEMHRANHPGTRHLTDDVFRADVRKAVGERPVGLAWFSPDCKHFSRAKGGKPVNKNIRGLAWVAIQCATNLSPRVIVLENVREFQDWGPLIPLWKCACGWKGTEGQATTARRGKRACPRCDSADVKQTTEQVPNPDKKGLTFRQFCGRLRALGYEVQWRVLNASDFGAPTHRRRLFLVARRDAKPIAWPDETHGDPRKVGRDLFSQSMRPWRTAAECIDWTIPCPSIFGRDKPLRPNTERRIAHGFKRFVLDNPRPFLVRFNTEKGPNDNNAHGLDRPINTVTADPRFGLVTPVLMPHYGGSVAAPADGPLPTVTAGGMGKQVLIAPSLVQSGYGERNGQAPRVLDVRAPLGTVVGGGQKHGLVAAFLAKHFGGVVGHHLERPLGTVTAVDHHSLAAVNLVHMNHGDKQWNAADEPLRAVTTGGHAALVYSFLVKYFGTAVGQAPDVPLHTVTGKDRFGLVYVTIEGESYLVVDIGMRMLQPRELARAQGFPDSYLLTGSKTNQVARIGNSVCPDVACAIVKVNCGDLVAEGRAA